MLAHVMLGLGSRSCQWPCLWCSLRALVILAKMDQARLHPCEDFFSRLDWWCIPNHSSVVHCTAHDLVMFCRPKALMSFAPCRKTNAFFVMFGFQLAKLLKSIIVLLTRLNLSIILLTYTDLSYNHLSAQCPSIEHFRWFSSPSLLPPRAETS